jgi:hypothetical protein
MRLTIALTLTAALAVTTVQAVDPGNGGNTAPTDDAVINLGGASLAKVFAQFGTPSNVYAYRGSTPDDDGVTVDYDTFGFNVNNKTVCTCLFWSGWKGTINGIKIGQSRQDVENVLGTAHQVDKTVSQSAQGDFGFDLIDAVFWVDFDKNDKVCRVDVDLN